MNTETNISNTVKEGDGYTKPCNKSEAQNIKERLNLLLPKELLDYLREDAENSYKSVTCVIIEILNFNKFILDAIRKGYKLALEDPNGKTHYLMIGNIKHLI